MIRFPRPVVLALVLPGVGACWLDVPNLETTEGGYAQGEAGPRESPDPGVTNREEATGEAPAPESSPAETVPTSEAADPGSAE